MKGDREKLIFNISLRYFAGIIFTVFSKDLFKRCFKKLSTLFLQDE